MSVSENFEPNGSGASEQPRAARGGLIRALERRKFVILAAMVIVTGVSLALSFTQKKQYTATATLLFQNVNYAQGLFGSSAAFSSPVSSVDPTREAATNLGLLQQGIIAQLTARRLGDGYTRSKVIDEVSVAAGGQSDLVNVAATTGLPALSARVANAYANAFIGYRKQADSRAILDAGQEVAARLQAMSPSARNSSAGRELAARQQDLNILASLQTGNAQLSEPADAPSGPSSPKPVRNALVGLFAGLVLGIALALVLERFDRRVRDVGEFEELFGRPVLGLIPRSRRLAAQRATPGAALESADAEPFRLLRANLRYLKVDGGGIRTLIVSSSAPQEGKSTVAYNLALVSASSGQRVVLVEADLRRPVLGKMISKHSGRPGLSDVLADRVELREAVDRLPITMVSDVDDRLHSAEQNDLGLDVITAGTVPPNPSDLLESERMRELIAYLRSEYDLVIIDTPPTSAVSDAIHLLGEVDGVLILARLGKTSRDLAELCARQMARVNAPVLGIVVNSANESPGYGGYSYTYESTSSARVTIVATS